MFDFKELQVRFIHRRWTSGTKSQTFVWLFLFITRGVMFTVYAIKSTIHNFIYVGMTENLEERFSRHNNGYVQSTKNYRPFNLIYQEQAADGIQARVREKYLKSTSGKRFLRNLGGIGR